MAQPTHRLTNTLTRLPDQQPTQVLTNAFTRHPNAPTDQQPTQDDQDLEILHQNMPNATESEKTQAFHQYKAQRHWAERKGANYTIYDHLQSMGINTNQHMSPDAQGRLQKGRQGPLQNGMGSLKTENWIQDIRTHQKPMKTYNLGEIRKF